MYEVNLWLWQFGRGKPLLRELSVADTEVHQTELQSDSHRTRKGTLHGRVQSDLALKKAGCAKIYHVYPILI